MAAPTSYTENGLALFLLNDPQLRPVWDTIGIDEEAADGALAEVINDTLLAMGKDQIADVSGREEIAKLRTLARYNAWIMVTGNFTIDINYAADGESFSRDQLFAHAQAMLALWESKAAAYLGTYKVKKSKLFQPTPYNPGDCDL